MVFYLYNQEITPEYDIPEGINKDSLKKITVNDAREDDPNHFLHVSFNEGSIVVKIGENNSHPMDDNEYIEWIALEIDGKIVSKLNLSKDAEPMALFLIENIKPEEIVNHKIFVYAYCNQTGIWKNILKM